MQKMNDFIFLKLDLIDIISPKIIDILMMKLTLIVLTIFVTTHALYTSSFFEKKGINVKDGKLQQGKHNQDIKVETVCNAVDLSTPPFNHSGVVHSGYLSVNKGGSGLAFIFYGKEGASKEEIKNIPTIIWLNGGPGSSSQLGNFMQLGPTFVKPANMAPW